MSSNSNQKLTPELFINNKNIMMGKLNKFIFQKMIKLQIIMNILEKKIIHVNEINLKNFEV